MSDYSILRFHSINNFLCISLQLVILNNFRFFFLQFLVGFLAFN